MVVLTPRLQHLLNRMLVSLPAWHVLEALALAPAEGVPVRTLIATTGLDVGPCRSAVLALRRLGLVRLDDRVRLAPRHAADVRRLVQVASADRGFMLAVIKQAARREYTAGPLLVSVRRARLSGPRRPR